MGEGRQRQRIQLFWRLDIQLVPLRVAVSIREWALCLSAQCSFQGIALGGNDQRIYYLMWLKILNVFHDFLIFHGMNVLGSSHI